MRVSSTHRPGAELKSDVAWQLWHSCVGQPANTAVKSQRSTNTGWGRESNWILYSQSSLRHLSLMCYKGAFFKRSQPFYLWDICLLSPFCPPAISFFHCALVCSTGHLFLCLYHQACGSAAHSLTAGFLELMIAVPPPSSSVSSAQASASRVLFVSSAHLTTR